MLPRKRLKVEFLAAKKTVKKLCFKLRWSTFAIYIINLNHARSSKTQKLTLKLN